MELGMSRKIDHNLQMHTRLLL